MLNRIATNGRVHRDRRRKVAAFLELERVTRESISPPKCRMIPAIVTMQPFARLFSEGQEIDCKMPSNAAEKLRIAEARC
jgi:hypothetical protein